jgi:hypothetical protein
MNKMNRIATIKGQTGEGVPCKMHVDLEGNVNVLYADHAVDSVTVSPIGIGKGAGVSVGGAALGAAVLGPVGLLAGARIRNKVMHVVVINAESDSPIVFVPSGAVPSFALRVWSQAGRVQSI